MKRTIGCLLFGVSVSMLVDGLTLEYLAAAGIGALAVTLIAEGCAEDRR